MRVHPNPRFGIACVLMAATLWGTTGTAQALAGGTLSSLWFGALRLLVAAAFFAVFAAVAGGARRAAWQGLALIDVLGAGLCMAVYNLAFFGGVRLTGVAIGTAIALGSGPIWAGLLQALLQRAPPGANWWAGTSIAVAGGVLLSAGGHAGPASVPASGVAMCLISGLAYAVYTLLNKRMVAVVPASTITLAAFGIAAALAVPAAWVGSGTASIGPRDALAVVYTGVVSAGIAFLVFSHALHHISPASGVSLALCEPVVAFGLAVMVLGESAGTASIAGLLLVVAGVLGVMRAELGGWPSNRIAAATAPCRAVD